MDFKTFKLMVFYGPLGRRVIIRAFVFTVALSVVPLLQMLSGACFYVKVWGSFGSVQCEENMNLTTSVVRELMSKKLLSHSAKALCIGEGSVSALRDLGFSDVNGVYRHPFFSLKHKKFDYELDYPDDSYDFVISRDLDKVSAPAILMVLEIERVLKPGGIGSVLFGPSGLDSDPSSLIRSATPVSSLVKASSVVHVDYANGFTLIVFKKKLENATYYFEQYRLPADCRSMTNTKAVLDNIEPLSEEKPVGFGKTIAYLPEFVNVLYKQRLVYIEIGASEHLNSDVTDWFLPSYPVDRNAFDVYFVDHNTSVMLYYVNKPGINFVYYPGLAGNGVTSINSYNIDDDSDPFVEDEGFDFLLWIKETVRYADFVVLKMNAGAAGMKILSDLFESGTICFIDELFLHCSSDQIKNVGAVKGNCLGLFKALRTTGVYVHQWWGN